MSAQLLDAAVLVDGGFIKHPIVKALNTLGGYPKATHFVQLAGACIDPKGPLKTS